MKTSGNTILITGGGSGIGLEIARLFSAAGNTVILTGRSGDKLKTAAAGLQNVHFIPADITRERDVDTLAHEIETHFPKLNILVNNAGYARIHDVSMSPEALNIARLEMETNYFAVINLTNRLLTLLRKQADAAIVNVSSVVAFAPGLSLPTYSASKAALHSYTQALRLSLRLNSRIKVFELMPPLVDTELAKDIKSSNKISPAEVAAELIDSIEKDRFEIHVASAERLYTNFLGQADKLVLTLNGLEIN